MSALPKVLQPAFLRWGAAGSLIVVFAGCGGGEGGGAHSVKSNEKSAIVLATDTPRQAAIAAPNAKLTESTLVNAEQQAQAADSLPAVELYELQPGQIAPKSAYLSGDVARKALAVRIPAYRFYNTRTSAHFYTVSETERANVAATLSPPFSYDGPAFSVASAHSAGLSSVHRFYNTQTGVHFYTISETERANVVATLPQFNYEGVAYYASQVAGAGLVPLYRFYVPSRGFHFYTASAAEKANIQAALSAIYIYEGIGYYVLDTGWAGSLKVPHTGITNAQCYQAGSNVLVDCSSGGATTLNPQQDGHRVAVNPMNYSRVPSIFGPYPVTSCVRDNVTRLDWEGKEASGPRAGVNLYTNVGDASYFDSQKYVNEVNASALCGFTDWRMPTRQELLGLMDVGAAAGVRINTTWFPNTVAARYWSADVLSTASANAWYVGWDDAGSDYAPRASAAYAVRLVRGSPVSGPRFSYSTVAYGDDGVNNTVNDAWTGLQWRRCEEGRVWGGSRCTGTASRLTHESALIHARGQAGWRLPNVKELSSLVDLSVSSGARINQAAFLGAEPTTLEASSPSLGVASSFYGVSFFDGFVGTFIRSTGNVGELRLVRISP